MKIICIGHNYVEHTKELNSEIPTEPVFFLKPDTALLRDNQAFYLPDFSNEIHHEVELLVKISKNGKHIDEAFAGNYYEEIGIGIDFTARDIQRTCKLKGLPWEKAKAFDGSAPIGRWISKKTIAMNNQNGIDFHLTVNNKMVQHGNSTNMIFSFDQIIAYVSKFITLRQGDILFTGTPKGVGPVAIGDRLEAFIGNTSLLNFEVK